MAIVIKEVIVKTTVERKEPQWSQPTKDIVKQVKQEVLAEFAEHISSQPVRRRNKDR